MLVLYTHAICNKHGGKGIKYFNNCGIESAVRDMESFEKIAMHVDG